MTEDFCQLTHGWWVEILGEGSANGWPTLSFSVYVDNIPPPSKSFVVFFFTANVYYVIVCNVLDANVIIPMCNSVTKLVIFKVDIFFNTDIHFSKYSNASI